MSTVDGGVHGFPAVLTSFVGRAGAVREVAGLLEEYRLVTITGETVSAASSANTPRSHRVTPFPAPTRSAGIRFCRASRWRRSASCSTATRISTRRMRPSKCVSSSRCRECRRRTRQHRCSQWPRTSAFVPWCSRHSTSNPTSAVRMARNPSPSFPSTKPRPAALSEIVTDVSP